MTTWTAKLRAMVLRYDAAVTSVSQEWQSQGSDARETTPDFKQKIRDRIAAFTPK